MIKVNFRVTGIYFGSNKSTKKRSVVLEVNENPTVEDLLKAARNSKIHNVDFFDFSGNATNGIGRITVKYKNEIKIEVIDENGNPSGYRTRSAGTYTLTDERIGNRKSVFQYYIYDGEFKQMNNNNFTKLYTDKPDEPIKDGYNVVIRQVSILTSSEESFVNNQKNINI